jgi:hypothetical protein
VNSTEEVKKKLLDYDENVGFKTLFNFEGVLSGYSYGSFFFNNCSVNILKSCE